MTKELMEKVLALLAAEPKAALEEKLAALKAARVILEADSRVQRPISRQQS
jgi:hypothetical protein